MKLLIFSKQSKEKKAIKLAKRLRATLISLGYNKPKHETANCINIWEHDTGLFKVDEMHSGIKIESKI